MELNPEQLVAVQHIDGPILVLAGAGSGKTRVIIQRIAYLVQEQHVSPYNILAVTFTNKAAGEMKERIARLLGGGSQSLWISTFHSACLRILRQSIDRLGYPRDFLVYDDDDQKTLLKNCLKELKLDDKVFPLKGVAAKINAAKNELIDPDHYGAKDQEFFVERMVELYRLYQRKLRENKALDFGDLICKCVELFQQHPQVLHHYQNLFRYIMIDEYQDTNHAQYVLVRLLASGHRNLCVVGDEDQSIYRWRGANVQNILDFEKDNPGTRVIKLEQNYRSTQTILTLATRVVENNQSRKGKVLWTQNEPGEKGLHFLAADERLEAGFVAEEITRLQLGQQARYSDCAIFYRTNAQSRVFEEELRRHKIPYKIFGGMKFYERMEIKDILAYLRLLIHPEDSVSLQRVLNVPARGIGQKTVESIMAEAMRAGISLYETIQRICEGGKEKMRDFVQLIEGLKLAMDELGLAALVEAVIDKSGYRAMLKKEGTIEAEGRLENLEELLNVLSEYATEQADREPRPTTRELLGTFLDEVALVGQTDNVDPEQGVVSLMTLHLAKGLEFPYVFLVGMEEGLFPHSRSLDEEEEMEEERRLCYVGITRARKKIYLTNAQRRRLYGGDQFNLPSRFLDEMPQELLEQAGLPQGWGQKPKGRWGDEVWSHEAMPSYDQPDPTYSDHGESDAGVKIGMKVRHTLFGPGVIKRREGKGEGEKVTVYFEDGRVKVLMLKFANLDLG